MQQVAVQQARLLSAAPQWTGSRSRGQAQRSRAVGGRTPLLVAASIAEGGRIKVTAPIKVFHVGKFKEGLDLQGMEGTVLQPNVCDYKHHDGQKHDLSATLPVKVQFAVPAPDGGKDVKVIAHLATDEVEAV